MRSEKAIAQTVAPRRFIAFFVPNGTDPGKWHPTGGGGAHGRRSQRVHAGHDRIRRGGRVAGGQRLRRRRHAGERRRTTSRSARDPSARPWRSPRTRTGASRRSPRRRRSTSTSPITSRRRRRTGASRSRPRPTPRSRRASSRSATAGRPRTCFATRRRSSTPCSPISPLRTRTSSRFERGVRACSTT